MIKRIKVRDFIEAIRKDGYKKIQGTYYLTRRDDREYFGNEDPLAFAKDSEVVGGCAFGQAALNLGVGATGLDTAVRKMNIYIGNDNISNYIKMKNDRTSSKLTTIAKLLDKNISEEDKEKVIVVVE